MDFVEVIRYGFHGLAFAMLFLGYRLLKTIHETGGSGHKSILAEERERQYRSIYIFMGISLLFFILGVSSEMYRQNQERSHQTQEADLHIVISPNPLPWDGLPMPKIIKDSEVIHFNETNDPVSIKINQRGNLVLQLSPTLNPLLKEINDKKYLLARQLKQSDQGLDDEF